jgi:hypothetical protein
MRYGVFGGWQLMVCSSAIKVVARFRPPNALELAQGGETIVSFETDDTLALDMKSVLSKGDNRVDRLLGRRYGTTFLYF